MRPARPSVAHGPSQAVEGLSPPLARQRPQSRPRNTSKTVLRAGLTLLAAAALFVGFRYLMPHDVPMVTLTPGPFTVDLSGPGTLSAINSSSVSSRIQGLLVTVAVDRNDRVTSGQVIAEIASDDLESQLTSAEASRDAADRAVEAAQADHDRAAAGLTHATTTLERQKALLPQGNTAQSTYDSALSDFKAAESDLRRAAATVEQSRAQAASASATAAFNRSKLQDAIIRAPFDGMVIARDHNPGDVVTPGSQIVQIADPATIVLTVRFDESAIASVRKKQGAVMTFTSQPDRPISGQVLRLSREVDPETREFTVDITLDELPDNWAIGQRGSARITIDSRAAALSVPSSAISRKDGVAGLWVVAGGRAFWRPVTLGRIGGARVEVTGGAQSGDIVLTAPQGAYAGMKVTPGSPT